MFVLLIHLRYRPEANNARLAVLLELQGRNAHAY